MLSLLLVATASHCSAHDGQCAACVGDTSLLGTCRFCPVDQKCHDHGAIFENPCSFASTRNVHAPAACLGPLNPPTPAHDEVPLYCGILDQGLQAVAWEPLLKALHASGEDDVPVVGPVELTMEDLEFGAMALAACDASAANSSLAVKVASLQVELTSFAYSYKQQRWPHAANSGKAAANLTLSLSLAVDLATMTTAAVDVAVDAVHVALKTKEDPWVYDAVAWLANHMRPVISAAVQHEARNLITDALSDMKKEGSCEYASELIHEIDSLHPQIVMREPEKVKVPVFGTVDVRLNSTHIAVPANVTCGPWAFNGTDLQMEFSDMQLGMDFNWSYQKENSTFWHNAGTGHAKATCGVSMHVDLVHPSTGAVAVSMPHLDLKLHADADAWMYDALTAVVRPIFRLAVQEFAGDLLRKELACLADPKCTHVPPQTTILV